MESAGDSGTPHCEDWGPVILVCFQDRSKTCSFV